MQPLYTLPQARFILSHVYCVHCLPEGGGIAYRYSRMFGEALCCRCTCNEPADLRLYVASVAEATVWLEKENAAVAAYNATKP